MADNKDLCFGITPFTRECKVLSGTILCNGLKKDCPFFKTKAENDAELIKYNGTTNLKTIASAYAEGRIPLEESKIKYITKPTFWSDDENTLLLNLVAEGIEWKGVSKMIGRSESACYKHWRKLQHEMEDAS